MRRERLFAECGIEVANQFMLHNVECAGLGPHGNSPSARVLEDNVI